MRLFSLLIGIIFLTGCQTMAQPKAENESRRDVKEALGTIAEAISGKQLNEKELKDLSKDLRTNKEAQSAIQSITNSMNKKAVIVKYCPITGKRYAPRVIMCPEHHVKLKILKDEN